MCFVFFVFFSFFFCVCLVLSYLLSFCACVCIVLLIVCLFVCLFVFDIKTAYNAPYDVIIYCRRTGRERIPNLYTHLLNFVSLYSTSGQVLQYTVHPYNSRTHSS